jgi:type IV pilus assembly protein PilA
MSIKIHTSQIFNKSFLVVSAIRTSSNHENGFTLVELLVVIIIIGILAAISLPSFLNQAGKARQSEAKTYVSSMNRAQQIYFSEKRIFATPAQIGNLGLGFSIDTQNYQYRIDCGAAPFNNCLTSVNNQARPQTQVLRAYLGGISISNALGVTNDVAALSALCEAILPPANSGADGTENFIIGAGGFSNNAAPICPVATYIPIY